MKKTKSRAFLFFMLFVSFVVKSSFRYVWPSLKEREPIEKVMNTSLNIFIIIVKISQASVNSAVRGCD